MYEDQKNSLFHTGLLHDTTSDGFHACFELFAMLGWCSSIYFIETSFSVCSNYWLIRLDMCCQTDWPIPGTDWPSIFDIFKYGNVSTCYM